MSDGWKGVLPVDVWWRTVSAGEKVHIPPIDNDLRTHLYLRAAWLRGRTPETAFQTTCRENENESAEARQWLY